MSRLLLLPAVLLFLLPASSAALAEGSGWEITPFAALHLGGSFDDNTTGASLDAGEGAAFGFIIGAPDEIDTRYEFLYSFQRTNLSADGTFGGDTLFDLDVHYFHLGGSYRYMEGKVHPFVAGGLGATHFVPRGDGPGSKTYFSLSLGAGAMVPVSGSVALRFEGRGFLTILPETSTIFCVSSGGAACAVNVQGDVFGEFLLMTGLVFSL
jgi:opacity protein-like surface antigen